MAGILMMMLILIPIACAEDAEDRADTATIAPATPQPNVEIEGDPALTQTVEPGEDRSPYEGGPLEDDEVIGSDTSKQQPRQGADDRPPQ